MGSLRKDGTDRGRAWRLALRMGWMNIICFKGQDWDLQPLRQALYGRTARASLRRRKEPGDNQSEAACPGSHGVSVAKPKLEPCVKITKQSPIHSFFSSKPGGFMKENSHGICKSFTQRLNMNLEIWLFLFFTLEANQLTEQTTRCYLEIKHISSLGLQRLTFVGDFIQMSHPIPCLWEDSPCKQNWPIRHL